MFEILRDKLWDWEAPFDHFHRHDLSYRYLYSVMQSQNSLFFWAAKQD